MKIKACDIVWDLEAIEFEDDEADPELPEEVELDLPDDFDPEESLADELSDRYGFCVKSVNYQIL